MSVIVNEIRRGFYLDSVALMRLSAEITALSGVTEAVMMTGTPSNLQIMRDANLLNEDGAAACSNDLIIALRTESDGAANRAIAHARKSLQGGALKSSSQKAAPRSLDGAVAQLPNANLALISTPGQYAAREARAALQRGLNVMMFSDNVSLFEELELKRQAEQLRLLIMGPDCGTAILNGTPLAFANVVPSGDTAVIAASGTGLQEFSVLLARLGGGVLHGIGVGGRDLSDDIGGLSTLRAIELLASDERIKQIVLISKPPGQATASRVFERLQACAKPVIACVFGHDQSDQLDGIQFANTLKEAAELAAGKSLDSNTTNLDLNKIIATRSPQRCFIRGLYTGGTLASEAQIILIEQGMRVCSNAPVPRAAALDSNQTHRIIDLGADEYTLGKPHPMIEPSVRTASLLDAMADPQCGVVLLDVVLGYGSHNTPAEVLVSALGDNYNDSGPVIVASVCGTDADPQSYSHQKQVLGDAGVIVCASNADAVSLSGKLARELAARSS